MTSQIRHAGLGRLLAGAALLLSAIPTPALANHTPPPASVNLVGSLQSEATGGACGDWDPGCAGSAFTARGNLVYTFDSASIPAGAWEYKVAMGSWAEDYGANFQQGGPNIALNLAAPRTVRFYYDHKTHYIANRASNAIYTLPGSFNSEIGCPGDWQPDCLRTFMSDVDGDGVFTFVTDAIPPGSYEFKVAENESWDVSWGAPGGNFALTVPSSGIVTFRFDTATHLATTSFVSSLPSLDNNVEWAGLRHDTRDPLYRAPGGAVPAGAPVMLRFRTFHNDVSSVTARIYDLNAGGQRLAPMAIAAADVDCYDASITGKTCDFWQVTLNEASPNNLWYRFIVRDGTSTAYYGDNTAALDGGLGAPTSNPVDNSYALMFFDPAFTTPAWMKNAVIYQIFPDRFNNGRKDNDPKTGDTRYDDPVLRMPWGTLPEGYCRNYADGGTNCPWRFDTTPPDWSPTKEGPRGRDYYGGDLKGVDQKLEYLRDLGVNTIYFNPIFDAGSNHAYDTQDFLKIDPYFGTQKDWENLVKHAKELGIQIVLDGVFNHMSSDSPNFDRYLHYATTGACESASSSWRGWFTFRAPAGLEPSPCAPTVPGGADTYYDGWFGFDSIPVLNKNNAAVLNYFVTGRNSVARTWLRNGAGGWRLDVMGDSSFPSGYWETFRSVVKSTRPDGVIIGELWQKDSTLLRFLRGDRADSTMNYRLRDAIIGLLTPGPFDSKGFGDSGRILQPSEFTARMASIQEDYPRQVAFSLMNLVDSHDTERLLWTLTPGSATRADKEFNAANVAAGKRSLRVASLIQFSMPGAPTIYYGDEVGVTGADDPDDRRTYPWGNKGDTPDDSLRAHYTQLAALRRANPALIDGNLSGLLADDLARTLAYGRKTPAQAAIVAVNRSATTQTLSIPVAGFVPDGTTFQILGAQAVSQPGPMAVSAAGALLVTLGPADGALLLTQNGIDLLPPAPPALSLQNEGNAQVTLSWPQVAGAAAYNLYRSPVSGGGYVKVNSAPLPGPAGNAPLIYTDVDLRNGVNWHYIVRALDAASNESAASNQVVAMPHLQIGWANLQWPPSISHIISVLQRTDTAYGQVWIDGATQLPGPTSGLLAQLGFGPQGSNPAGNAAWAWVDAAFNGNAGNNDEFKASLLPESVGVFNYVYRYSTTNGRDWLYADQNGPIPANALPPNPGVLTVSSSSDVTPPAPPLNLRVVAQSPAGIELAWDAVPGDPSLFGYEVYRGGARIATVTGNTYVDVAVEQGASYAYTVRALDTSFNRSDPSNAVNGTAQLRTVTLTFNVTVPATTDATGKTVYIAGFLDRLDGGLPQWNPGGVSLTRVDATHWAITLTGKESTQIEYKYTLGAWDFVEKDGACGEVSNRALTLTYGGSGTQTVSDTVVNWRNVAPCGN